MYSPAVFSASGTTLTEAHLFCLLACDRDSCCDGFILTQVKAGMANWRAGPNQASGAFGDSKNHSVEPGHWSSWCYRAQMEGDSHKQSQVQTLASSRRHRPCQHFLLQHWFILYGCLEFYRQKQRLQVLKYFSQCCIASQGTGWYLTQVYPSQYLTVPWEDWQGHFWPNPLSWLLCPW